MDPVETLSKCLDNLRGTVASVPADEWDTVTNCEPWTADVLLGHALASQQLWLGAVDGDERVSLGAVMSPEPVGGDRLARVDAVIADAIATWRTPGVLERDLTGPFGTLPGSATLVFPSIDALAHTWDLASSVGLDPELSPEMLEIGEALVAAAVNDTTRSFGLFAEPPTLPDDATDTDRLMAKAGRIRTRPAG